MIHAQNDKHAILIKPASIATSATSTGNVDTLGYNYAQIKVILDTQAATSSNPSELTLSHGADTVYTNATAISTGDTDFTIPNADTSDPQTIVWNVPCATRERYLHVSLSPAGAAQICCVTATLSRASGLTPNTAALSGVAAIVNLSGT